MRVNPTYRSLLDKSVNSMLSAIEIYNKPNFSYREETFSILAINALELLFKSKLLKEHNYYIRSLYVLEPVITKTGKPHKRNKKPKETRSGNPITISIFKAIEKLRIKGFSITDNFNANIESLVELRNNSIHFHSDDMLAKEIQEIGFATIKNYINIIKKWELEIDLSSYNFYLMPLAYVDAKTFSEGITTDEVSKYRSFVKDKVDNSEQSDEDFDIAISIDVNFKKGNSFEGVTIKYGEDGIPIALSDEEIRLKYPLTYDQLRKKASIRYSNFVQNNVFYKHLKRVKENPKLYHERKLEPNNPKSQKKPYYSSNVWQELDKFYTKR